MKSRILIIILSAFAVIYIVPVFITIIKSFQYDKNIFTLRQYSELLITNYTAMHFFWISMLYAVLISTSCVILSFPLGFLFAKVSFPGRDAIFFIYIIVMLLPFQATLLPNYIQLNDMKLLNTPYALMLPMMFSPFAVFLFRQFIMGFPNEMIEYATLETSSTFQLLRYIMMPQLKEVFSALGVLIFCESWNMVEQAIIFTPEAHNIWPFSVTLTLLPQDVTYAGATLYLYPILVMYFLFRDILQKSMEKFRW